MAAVPEYFGSMVFDDRVMKANLSAEVYQPLKRTIDQGEKLNIRVANASQGKGITAAGLGRLLKQRGCGSRCRSWTPTST